MKEKILFNLEKRGQMPRKELYANCAENLIETIEFKKHLKELINDNRVKMYYNTNICYKLI